MFCQACGHENAVGTNFCSKCGGPLSPYVPPRSSPAQFGENTLAFAGYAGFWKRFGAAMLDGFVLILADTLAGAVFGGGNSAMSFIPGPANILTGKLAVMTIAKILYFILMESSSAQATLGKMALGIKVTTLDGQRIGVGRATGRYFGKIVSTLILFIGFIMAGFTEKKQALHDIMAGTLVVNKK